MRVFGRYFAHRAKSTLARFLIIAVLTLIYLMPILAEKVGTYTDVGSDYIYRKYGRLLADQFNTITFLMCLLCTIIPILEFASFHNRKNADTMLSMPISRPKLALVHYLNGAWQIVTLVTCYLLMYVYVLNENAEKCLKVTSYAFDYDVKLFIPFYFTVILTCLMAYSFFVLVFNFANNVTDGVVFVLTYIFAGMLFVDGLDILLGKMFVGGYSENMLPYKLTIDVSSNFFDALMNDGKLLKYAFSDGWIINDMIIPMIIAAVGTAVFVACLIWILARKKAEKIEGISTSPFGYALLIPLYGMSFSAILFSNSFEIQTSAFIIIPMVVGYMIYRRSFKLKIIDLIMLALTVGMMIVADPISEIF